MDILEAGEQSPATEKALQPASDKAIKPEENKEYGLKEYLEKFTSARKIQKQETEDSKDWNEIM